MEQGEQSCKMFGNCTHTENRIKDCNVDCDYYNPIDGIIEPSSISKKPKLDVKSESKSPIIKLSDLPKFDKTFEFVVLKKHVFYMQSISPKKIILKFKRKLKDTNTLPDGVYGFTDTQKNKLDVKKIFKGFDAERREKEKKEKEKTNV